MQENRKLQKSKTIDENKTSTKRC
uniref:Uncharacterized protein n=1 Tax=Rhizophora mucronata TaxID=61149 RepID=A0A2P2QW87_RHIMU